MGNPVNAPQRHDRSDFYWVAGAAFVTIGVSLVAVIVADSSFIVAGGIAAFVATAIWLLKPAKESQAPKLLVLFAAAYVFSSVIPTSASLGLQALAIVAAIIAWLRVPAAERRGRSTVSIALTILVLWAAFMFNPNVPDVATGLLGFRKTAFCVAGIIAGCAIPKRMIGSVELAVARILILAVGISIIAFLFIPSLEALVNRSADEYTALIGGQKRLQGIFAGPFHAALGSMVLMGWGIVRFNVHRMTAVVALAVGTLALYLTLVRSAYAGVAIMVIALVVIAPSFGKFFKRFSLGILAAGILGALVITQMPSLANTALSIFGFESDGRFLNRLPEYAKGIAMFEESPLFGMGAGSAGDTLGPAFAAGYHVTPHNMFLKVLVEGGLVWAIAWGALAVSIIRRTRWLSPGGRLSIAVFSALIGLGLTGSAIDTLPISFLVFFFAGLAIDTEPARKKHHRPQAQVLPSDAYRDLAGMAGRSS
jgi:O-antigen ligase